MNPYSATMQPDEVTNVANPLVIEAESAAPMPDLQSLETDEDAVRWWTPLAICAVSLGMFLGASLVMAMVAVVVVHGKISLELLRDPASMEAVAKSRLGLLILVVAPQLALVAPSIFAAVMSPVPTRRRLGLVLGNWPVWVWFAAAAATPLVGLVSGVLVGSFLEESETLREMTGIFRDHGQSGFLIPLALMIGATPALCEELLFRGYVQTRFTRAFGPFVGIMVASVLFAAFHMDFVHIVAVFPLGLFLGWVTWQSGSLFPAMLGHFVNNVISVVAVVITVEEDPSVLALPTIAFTLLILGLGVIGMMTVMAASVYYRKPN